MGLRRQALKTMSGLGAVVKDSFSVASVCPMCRTDGAVSMINTPIDIPYFGEALETLMRCRSCGFKHADFMIMAQKDPLSLTYVGQGEEALQVRVIRSNSGTIRIPELGFLAEPTPLSESFVSNIEGVLDRAKDILLTAMNWYGDDVEKRALLEQYLARHQDMLHGREPITLVIDDPYGNSAIVHESVQRRTLTEEEIATLKTGMIVLDKSDLEGGEGEDAPTSA